MLSLLRAPESGATQLRHRKRGISCSTSPLHKLAVGLRIPGDPQSSGLAGACPTPLLLLSDLPSVQQLELLGVSPTGTGSEGVGSCQRSSLEPFARIRHCRARQSLADRVLGVLGGVNNSQVWRDVPFPPWGVLSPPDPPRLPLHL